MEASDRVAARLHVGRGPGCFYYIMELADPAQPAASSRRETSEGGLARGQGAIDPETYTPRTLKHELYRRERLPVDECLRICWRDYPSHQG